MRNSSLPIIVFSILLAGCETQYSRNGIGFTGGVEAQMITNDTARISGRGNEVTNSQKIQDFIFLKAAETAEAQGFTHFGIIQSENTDDVSSNTTPGYMQTNYAGKSAYSTYVPGQTYQTRKPRSDAVVKFCKQDKNNTCAGMMSAKEVIANLGPKYFPKN